MTPSGTPTTLRGACSFCADATNYAAMPVHPGAARKT